MFLARGSGHDGENEPAGDSGFHPEAEIQGGARCP